MAASCLVAEGVKDPASKIVRARIPKRSRLPRPKRRALVGPVKLKAEAASHGYSPSSSPFFPPGQRSYEWPFPWGPSRSSNAELDNSQGQRARFRTFFPLLPENHRKSYAEQCHAVGNLKIFAWSHGKAFTLTSFFDIFERVETLDSSLSQAQGRLKKIRFIDEYRNNNRRDVLCFMSR